MDCIKRGSKYAKRITDCYADPLPAVIYADYPVHRMQR